MKLCSLQKLKMENGKERREREEWENKMELATYWSGFSIFSFILRSYSVYFDTAWILEFGFWIGLNWLDIGIGVGVGADVGPPPHYTLHNTHNTLLTVFMMESRQSTALSFLFPRNYNKLTDPALSLFLILLFIVQYTLCIHTRKILDNIISIQVCTLISLLSPKNHQYQTQTIYYILWTVYHVHRVPCTVVLAGFSLSRSLSISLFFVVCYPCFDSLSSRHQLIEIASETKTKSKCRRSCQHRQQQWRRQWRWRWNTVQEEREEKSGSLELGPKKVKDVSCLWNLKWNDIRFYTESWI